MKLLLAMLTLFAGTVGAMAQSHVNGYFRKNGTYVQPHVRTAPDSNRFNNYSTRGNVNPYTGQRGYVDPYRPRTNNNFGNSFGVTR